MSIHTWEWLLLSLSLIFVGVYEVWVARLRRHAPERISRSAHALLRQEWVRASMSKEGTDLVTVQTLRNSMMSSSIVASTAALALMGLLTLTGNLLGSRLLGGINLLDSRSFNIKEAILLLMIVALFYAFVCSAVSVRYYNHVGYMMTMPFYSPLRMQWVEPACVYVSHAGQLYGKSLRMLLVLGPLLIGLITPVVLLPGALLLIATLRWFDRVAVGRG
ncbi:MAG: DUF599 domain-containing protein [Burkholderiaceae bacterium]|jgi:hypothetical protein